MIICSDDHALNFVLGLGNDLFAEVPIVFCSVSGYKPSTRRHRLLTGLLESIDIKATLNVGLRLHPKTEEVVVITDMTRTGKALKAKADIIVVGRYITQSRDVERSTREFLTQMQGDIDLFRVHTE